MADFMSPGNYRDWDHVYLERANARIAELENHIEEMEIERDRYKNRIAELERELDDECRDARKFSERLMTVTEERDRLRAAIRDALHGHDSGCCPMCDDTVKAMREVLGDA